MTTTPPEDRLDRIERILERLAERQDRFDVQLEQLGEKVDRITTELGAKIDRIADELDQEAQATAHRSLEVDARFLQLERRMNQFVQNSEQDRNQAAIDRAEFRSTVEQLLRVLTQQINGGNGG